MNTHPSLISSLWARLAVVYSDKWQKHPMKLRSTTDDVLKVGFDLWSKEDESCAETLGIVRSGSNESVLFVLNKTTLLIFTNRAIK